MLTLTGWWFAGVLVGLGCLLQSCSGAVESTAERAWVPPPAAPPLGNPQVGLVPFRGQGHPAVPHSMEYDPVPLAELVHADGSFDWAPLERRLDDVAGRGHQLLLRVVLDNPAGALAIPGHLLRQGLRVTDYAVGELPSRSPDYEDPRLRRLLRQFIAALGARYDGDPRLGQITAGLLGAWGEWHTWPRDELFASKAVQREVLDAYAAAFTRTPVLLRRPVGVGDPAYLSTAGYPFGYHDDSFAFATLDTGREQDGWFFVPMLRRAGQLQRWHEAPIGGEVRPEVQAALFDAAAPAVGAQDFAACLRETHASWMIAQQAFGRGVALPGQVAAQVARMGYVLQVTGVRTRRSGSGLQVEVDVGNDGLAPCLLDWPVQIAVLAPGGGGPRGAVSADVDLAGLQPGGADRRLRAELPVTPQPGAELLLRVVSPLSGGVPVRFANQGQDQHLPGWLSLGRLDG